MKSLSKILIHKSFTIVLKKFDHLKYCYQGVNAVPHCVLVNGHSILPCGSLSHLACMYIVLIRCFFLAYRSLPPS